MQRLNNFFLLTLFITFVFLGINLFVSLFMVQNRLGFQHSGEKFVEIKEPLSFAYKPTYDNFNILIFTFKNPVSANQENFSLKILSEEKVIREITFSGFNLGDTQDLKFQFDPILDSKGKEFKIEISAQNYRNPIFINVDDKGIPSFKAYYRTTKKFFVLRNILSSWVNFVKSDLVFFSIWFLILILTSILGSRYAKK